LSHNDLSADNLLLTVKKQIIFIDYEWSRLNNEYWDLANFIRETKLSNRNITFLATKSNLSLTILQDFIYICTNYAYQWTYMMPQTTKILQYRKQLNKQLNLYYNKFF
jgi:thiamine kinase-like enzyme